MNELHVGMGPLGPDAPRPLKRALCVPHQNHTLKTPPSGKLTTLVFAKQVKDDYHSNGSSEG